MNIGYRNGEIKFGERKLHLVVCSVNWHVFATTHAPYVDRAS